MDNTKRFFLSFLQCICAISVVTLHTNGIFWQFSKTERYWLTANIIECLFYFAVPIFFMITGATLLNYQERYSTKEYFIRRIKKTVFPYVAWSFIGILFLLAGHKISPNDITLCWIINALLSTNQIIGIYWFFAPLFCVYLSIPMFASIEKEKKKCVAEYVIFVSFIVNITVPFSISVLDSNIVWKYRLLPASEYIFYIWVGYYLYFYPISNRIKWLIYSASVLGLLSHMVGTYHLSMINGKIIHTYKGYLNLPCIIYSIGIFVLIKDVAKKLEKNKKVTKFINYLAKYSFSLYLMHFFIMRIIEVLTHVDTRSIYYRLFIPYVIFTIVIFVTWILRKIPVIKLIVP